VGVETTLVQANELGINAIGVDISEFNTLISNMKVEKHDIDKLSQETLKITQQLQNAFSQFYFGRISIQELTNSISEFNKEFFPTPDILYRVRRGEIDLASYSHAKVK